MTQSFADIHNTVAEASLEWWLTDENAFGLTTATPLQRAICRLADGKPLRELSDDPTVRRSLGVDGSIELIGKPRELAVLAGIRGGKSLLAAAIACRASQQCDVSRIGAGEVPRVSIVSLTRDLADVVFSHVVGRLTQSSLLAGLVVGQPSTDSIHLRHPSGRTVQIKVVAGARAGASLVARWSAGCVFDEFPRMVGESEGVVNWDDSRAAVYARLLPGAQIINIGSPWAPVGPAYELVRDHWGKPTRSIVVIRAQAPDLNPMWWTTERVAEAAAGDAEIYRTDVLAEFRTPNEALFASDVLESITRREPETLPFDEACTYTAAMDPATRGNGWTLVIVTRKGGKKIVVKACEWIGSKSSPLNPEHILQEIARVCGAYRVTQIDTDQYMGDALQALARRSGITLGIHNWTADQRASLYLSVRTRFDMGEVELAPVSQLRSDLLNVRKRITARGVTIDLPETQDGRHCDYAPALVLALSRYLNDERQPTETPEKLEQDRLRKQTQERYGRGKENW